MVVKSTLPEVPIEKLNISFAGCGFLGIYHIGVVCCFKQYLPQICERKISGTSAGALVATALCCNLNLGKSASHILEVAIKARHRALGPFHPNFNINEIMLNTLNDVLPQNAHEYVNGKLNISVTRVHDGQNVILSNFETRADLIQAILCSCFIPFWSGYIPPKFQGVAYMDGGFSKNLLILDENTITVSPFSGESDICPLDSSYNAYKISFANSSFSLSSENLYRVTRILFPPSPEIMGKMCQQGFHDALRYLQRNNRIACTRCIAVQSTFIVNDEDENQLSSYDDENEDEEYLLEDNNNLNNLKSNIENFGESLEGIVEYEFKNKSKYTMSDDEIDEELKRLVEFNKRIKSKRKSTNRTEEFIHAMEHDFKNGIERDNCSKCRTRRENIYKHNLPGSVNKAIQDACEKVNKGLINYIFKFRIVKIMSTLSVPYILPFDITLVLLKKLIKLLPIVTTELALSLRKIINCIINLINGIKLEKLNDKHLTNVNYKVALTEYDYTDNNLTNNISNKPTRLRNISTSCKYSFDEIENKKPKMQKSHSFKLRRTNSIKDIREKLIKIFSNESLNITNSYVKNNSEVLHRKSYAGNENVRKTPERKISTLDFLGFKAPKRVLSKMNLNFSLDLNDLSNENLNSLDNNHNLPSYDSTSFSSRSKSLECVPSSAPSTRSGTPVPVLLANNAINLGINEIDYNEHNSEEFNKLKKLTSSREALMEFHYTDDFNMVQVTEIFNLPEKESNENLDASTSEYDSFNYPDFFEKIESNSLNQNKEILQEETERRERKNNLFTRN